MTTHKHFSFAEGLVIQQKDLEKWRQLINPAIFTALQNFCGQENAKVNQKQKDAGYNVVRGTDLTDFVLNFHAQHGHQL